MGAAKSPCRLRPDSPALGQGFVDRRSRQRLLRQHAWPALYSTSAIPIHQLYYAPQPAMAPAALTSSRCGCHRALRQAFSLLLPVRLTRGATPVEPVGSRPAASFKQAKHVPQPTPERTLPCFPARCLLLLSTSGMHRSATVRPGRAFLASLSSRLMRSWRARRRGLPRLRLGSPARGPVSTPVLLPVALFSILKRAPASSGVMGRWIVLHSRTVTLRALAAARRSHHLRLGAHLYPLTMARLTLERWAETMRPTVGS